MILQWSNSEGFFGVNFCMPEGLSSVLRLCSLDHRKLSPKTLGAAAPGGSHWVQMFSATLWSCRLFERKSVRQSCRNLTHLVTSSLTDLALLAWQDIPFGSVLAFKRREHSFGHWLCWLYWLCVQFRNSLIRKPLPKRTWCWWISWNRRNQIATNGFCVDLCSSIPAMPFPLMAHVAHASFMKPVSWSRCFAGAVCAYQLKCRGWQWLIFSISLSEIKPLS